MAIGRDIHHSIGSSGPTTAAASASPADAMKQWPSRPQAVAVQSGRREKAPGFACGKIIALTEPEPVQAI